MNPDVLKFFIKRLSLFPLEMQFLKPALQGLKKQYSFFIIRETHETNYAIKKFQSN